jgi:hypothetical protein
MMTIQIDEAVNGFMVYIDDSKSILKPYKEVCERKIDALQIVLNRVKAECQKEVKLIEEGGRLQ